MFVVCVRVSVSLSKVAINLVALVWDIVRLLLASCRFSWFFVLSR